MGLAEQAVREGHAVRIVTRTDERRTQIEAASAECWIGDPDRLGTLRGALEGVAIACWLLGDASGTDEQLRALHGTRLRAFLESAIDTTVRGVLYEAAGSTVPADALAEGERIANEVAGRNAMPLVVLRSDPGDPPRWLAEARGAVDTLLDPCPLRVSAPDALSSR
jgi:uncharacterized protein YbjT (DUF2867 family)